MNQPMYDRLAERVVANALINYRMDLESHPELTDPDNAAIKTYLMGSTDCVIHPHQLPALIEAFKKGLAQ